MEELKIVLFKETFYEYNRFLKLKEELGDYDRLTNFRYDGFRSLYTVIEDSGLEEEYFEWTNKQNEDI